MRTVILSIIVLCLVTTVLAEPVSVYSSGIFRGSMRHIVEINDLQEGGVLVGNVKPGDFISFRLPDKEYLKVDSHEEGLYIRNYAQKDGAAVVNYDLGTQKYLSLSQDEAFFYDIDNDETDDIIILFQGVDLRSGSFVVSTPALPKASENNTNNTNNSETTNETIECTIRCSADADCNGGECVRPGTCGSRCENIPEPTVTPPIQNTEVEQETASIWSRVGRWFRNLFS